MTELEYLRKEHALNQKLVKLLVEENKEIKAVCDNYEEQKQAVAKEIYELRQEGYDRD